MRVLHLVKTAVGATWALRQMTELVAAGLEIHVALPPGPRVAEYLAAGVHVHLADFDLPVRRPQAWHERFRRLRALVADVQPDLVHSHFVGTTLTMRLALGRRHRLPRLFQVPGPLHLEHAAFRLGELASAGPADYWIGTCKWTRERYRRSGVAAERVFLSYYGTDLERFAPRESGTLRRQLGMPEGALLVGMVAYMYAPKRYLAQTRGVKGHEDLIDALAVLQDQGHPVHGVFVGGAWGGAAQYEQRLRRYGRARLGERAFFLGTRDDALALYPDFDVAVHPSRSENLGGAAESLLLGVPTVSTDVGGLPDLMTAGETGWVVPPGRPELLAHALHEALADRNRARTLAARGQARAKAMLDVRKTSAEVHAIYQQVLGR